jgi:hypothetical protein
LALLALSTPLIVVAVFMLGNAERRAANENAGAVEAKNEEAELAKNVAALLKLLTDMASDDDKTRALAIETMKSLAANNKVDPALIPVIQEILKNRDPEAANDIKKAIQRAAESAPKPTPTPNATNQATRIFIHITDESQRQRAQQIQAKLRSLGFYAPQIQLVDYGPSYNQLKYFHRNETDAAKAMVTTLKSIGIDGVRENYIEGYENSTLIKPNQFELWFANTRTGFMPDGGYRGRAGTVITIRVAAEGTIPLVNYRLGGETKTLASDRSLDFTLNSTTNLTMLFTFTSASEGSYRVTLSTSDGDRRIILIRQKDGEVISSYAFTFEVIP